MATLLIEPYTPTGIVGATEVWDSGGQVYMITLEQQADGSKYSTSNLVEQLLERGRMLPEEEEENMEFIFYNEGTSYPNWEIGY